MTKYKFKNGDKVTSVDGEIRTIIGIDAIGYILDGGEDFIPFDLEHLWTK